MPVVRRIAALMVLILCGSSASAQDGGGELTNLASQVELARLVDLCADRLDLNIEYDASTLNGTVTLRLGGGVSDDELWAMTNRLLASRGFTSVRMPGEETLSIVRLADAPGLARVEDGLADGSAPWAGFVSVVRRIEHRPPSEIIDALQPLVSKPGGSVEAMGDERLLLVADLRPRVMRMLELVEALDVPGLPPVVERIALEHTDATTLATEITSAVTHWNTLEGSARTGHISPDLSDRSVLVVAPASEMAFWRLLVHEFDAPQPVVTRTHVPPAHVSLADTAGLLADAARAGGPRGSGDGWRVVANELAGTLIVTATPSEHRYIEELLTQLDDEPEARRQLRTFALSNRSVEDMLPILQELLDVAHVVLPPEEGAPVGERSRADQDAGGSGGGSGGGGSGGGSGGLTLTSDPETNTLIAVGEPRLLDQVGRMIDELDVRQPQVMLEVFVLSLSDGDTLDLGVELQKLQMTGDTIVRLSSLFGLSSVTLEDAALPTSGGGFTGVALNPGDFSVVVRALETLNDGRSLNVPKVLVNNNISATLDAVIEQPFVSTNASDTVATTSFGGFENAGTSITVTPQIARGDHLVVEYSVTLSAFVGESSAPGVPPPRQQNTLSSQVTIPDGYTVVVGGLEIESEADAVSRVPVLGSIPGVGELFTSRSESRSRARFYVFIRANILRHDGFEDLRYLSDEDLAGVGLNGPDTTGWPEVEPRVIR